MGEIIGYLSKIQIGENTYGIEDAIAREDIQSLSTLKANIASPSFTGTPEAPLADGSTTTQIANVQYVSNAILNALAANDAMVFKGILNDPDELPTADYQAGWTYKVGTAGRYAGMPCEQGDMVICVKDYDESTADLIDWASIQVNDSALVTGPASSVNGRVAVFNGTGGKLIADGGHVLGQDVFADSALTDTLYTATTTQIGSASAGTPIAAVTEVTFDGGSVPTREQISFASVDSWTEGTEGSKVSVTTSKVTAWNAGVTTAGEDVSGNVVSSWSAGSAMTAATTTVKEFKSFSEGVFPVFSVADGDTLVLTAGTLPSLSTNDKEINEVVTVGEAPSLSLTTLTASHITEYGSIPSLTYEDKESSKVESFGTMPTLNTTTTSVYSITDVGTVAELTSSTTNIPNISVTNVSVVNAISASTTGHVGN